MMIWNKIETARPITVNIWDQGSLLKNIGRHLDEKSGFSVATLNLDHVVKLKRDPAFRKAYAEHSYITADGNPIVWLSRLAGQKNVSLTPGSDVIEPVIRLAAEKQVQVALFGSDQLTLERAGDVLRRRCPGLDITMALAPPMGFDPTGKEADEAIARMASSGARLVFLALGAPKQEVFAARAQKKLPEVGFLSIGAGLDFLSGSQVRAPKWVRSIGAEWLWRLSKNPKRLAARYAACLIALPRLTLVALTTRLQSPAP